MKTIGEHTFGDNPVRAPEERVERENPAPVAPIVTDIGSTVLSDTYGAGDDASAILGDGQDEGRPKTAKERVADRLGLIDIDALARAAAKGKDDPDARDANLFADRVFGEMVSDPAYLGWGKIVANERGFFGERLGSMTGVDKLSRLYEWSRGSGTLKSDDQTAYDAMMAEAERTGDWSSVDALVAAKWSDTFKKGEDSDAVAKSLEEYGRSLPEGRMRDIYISQMMDASHQRSQFASPSRIDGKYKDFSDEEIAQYNSGIDAAEEKAKGANAAARREEYRNELARQNTIQTLERLALDRSDQARAFVAATATTGEFNRAAFDALPDADKLPVLAMVKIRRGDMSKAYGAIDLKDENGETIDVLRFAAGVAKSITDIPSDVVRTVGDIGSVIGIEASTLARSLVDRENALKYRRGAYAELGMKHDIHNAMEQDLPNAKSEGWRSASGFGDNFGFLLIGEAGAAGKLARMRGLVYARRAADIRKAELALDAAKATKNAELIAMRTKELAAASKGKGAGAILRPFENLGRKLGEAEFKGEKLAGEVGQMSREMQTASEQVVSRVKLRENLKATRKEYRNALNALEDLRAGKGSGSIEDALAKVRRTGAEYGKARRAKNPAAEIVDASTNGQFLEDLKLAHTQVAKYERYIRNSGRAAELTGSSSELAMWYLPFYTRRLDRAAANGEPMEQAAHSAFVTMLWSGWMEKKAFTAASKLGIGEVALERQSLSTMGHLFAQTKTGNAIMNWFGREVRRKTTALAQKNARNELAKVAFERFTTGVTHGVDTAYNVTAQSVADEWGVMISEIWNEAKHNADNGYIEVTDDDGNVVMDENGKPVTVPYTIDDFFAAFTPDRKWIETCVQVVKDGAYPAVGFFALSGMNARFGHWRQSLGEARFMKGRFGEEFVRNNPQLVRRGMAKLYDETVAANNAAIDYHLQEQVDATVEAGGSFDAKAAARNGYAKKAASETMGAVAALAQNESGAIDAQTIMDRTGVDAPTAEVMAAMARDYRSLMIRDDAREMFNDMLAQADVRNAEFALRQFIRFSPMVEKWNDEGDGVITADISLGDGKDGKRRVVSIGLSTNREITNELIANSVSDPEIASAYRAREEAKENRSRQRFNDGLDDSIYVANRWEDLTDEEKMDFAREVIEGNNRRVGSFFFIGSDGRRHSLPIKDLVTLTDKTTTRAVSHEVSHTIFRAAEELGFITEDTKAAIADAIGIDRTGEAATSGTGEMIMGREKQAWEIEVDEAVARGFSDYTNGRSMPAIPMVRTGFDAIDKAGNWIASTIFGGAQSRASSDRRVDGIYDAMFRGDLESIDDIAAPLMTGKPSLRTQKAQAHDAVVKAREAFDAAPEGEAKDKARESLKAAQAELNKVNAEYDRQRRRRFAERKAREAKSRNSIAKDAVERFTEGLTEDLVGRSIEKIIDDNLISFRLSEGDRDSIVSSATKFYSKYSKAIIPLSTGANLCFTPNDRTVERHGGDKVSSWAEYAIHAVTNDIRDKDGSHFRAYSPKKVEIVNEMIGDIVSNNRVTYDERRDTVTFYKPIDDGVAMVVARPMEGGNLSADMSDVTQMYTSKHLSPDRWVTLGELVEKGRTKGAISLNLDSASIVSNPSVGSQGRNSLVTQEPDRTTRLAPNGKRSNLTARQYDQVRTPEFKAWFGDWENDPANASKIVDENGEPRVMFHGSDAIRTEFKMNSGMGGVGAYFTSAFPEAADYVRDKLDNPEMDEDECAGYITECFLNVRDDSAIYSSGYGYGEIIVKASDPTQIKSATDNVGTFDANNPDIRYSIAEVEEAAKAWGALTDENGKPIVLYHGSDNKNEKYYLTDDIALFTTPHKDIADKFGSNGRKYAFYGRMNRPLVIDAKYHDWTDVEVPKVIWNEFLEGYDFKGETISSLTNEIADAAKKGGYDGVIIKNVIEGYGDHPTDDYIFLNPDGNVKRADEITYDYYGNEIPLDERFTESGDIRYSLITTTAEDRAAYEEAMFDGDDERAIEILRNVAGRAMPNTKVVGADGKPKVVYHHTENAFTKFDLGRARKSMDIQGFFFYDSPTAGEEYGRRNYGVFLNITNPYVIDSAEKMAKLNWDGSKDGEGVRVRDDLMAQGYDGVVRTAEFMGDVADEWIAFKPEQIKLAEPTYRDEWGDDTIGLDERFNPSTDDIRYSLILGEEGARRFEDNEKIIGNLGVAKRMLGKFYTRFGSNLTEDDVNELFRSQPRIASGTWKEMPKEERQRIKLSTGWEIGADGKWRYEEPFKLVDAFGGESVESLKERWREVQALYDKYDNDPLSIAEDPDAAYNVYKEAFKSYSKSKFPKRRYKVGDFIKGSLADKLYPELHGIQIVLKRMSDDHNGSYNRSAREISINKELDREDAIGTLTHEIQHAIQDLEGFASGASSKHPAYSRVAGEVEARNAESRTPEDIGRLLEDTEDVSRESQVILNDYGNALAKIGAAEGRGRFSIAKGEEAAVYIRDGVSRDGTPVSFTDLILDGLKKGETRTHNRLATGRWLGIAKDGNVVGRVMFGKPIEIDANSPEYLDAFISGTDYDIAEGGKKWYYPIVDRQDFRDSPIPLKRNGNYGVYDLPHGAKQIGEFHSPESQAMDGFVARETERNEDGETVVEVDGDRRRFSLATWEEGGRGILQDYLAKEVKEGRMKRADAQDMVSQMETMYTAMRRIEGKYVQFGAWSRAIVGRTEDGTPVMCVIKTNGDYAMNLDFSTLCKKRRAFDRVIREIIKRGNIDKMKLDEANFVEINKMIREAGFEVACELCFVDSKRYRGAGIASSYAKMYNRLVNTLLPEDGSVSVEKFNLGENPKLAKPQGKALHHLKTEDIERNFGKLDEEVEKMRREIIDSRWEEKRQKAYGYTGSDGKFVKGNAMSLRSYEKLRKNIPEDRKYDVEFAKGAISDSAYQAVYGGLSKLDLISKNLKADPLARRHLVREDLIDSTGFYNAYKGAQAIVDLYNNMGTAKPKETLPDVQFIGGEIVHQRSWTPDAAYAVGGVRVQSFSDFVPHMVFDYMQMFAELAAKGLPAHAYTKEPLFARIFGKSGLKVNMSLVPFVDERLGVVKGKSVGHKYAGLTFDGSWSADEIAALKHDKAGDAILTAEQEKRLVYLWNEGKVDTHGNKVLEATRSFPFDEAMSIQGNADYSDNCGTIAVGVSDAQIWRMLDDDNIRMIIPYHKSSVSPIVARLYGIDLYTDYTDFQTTKGAKSDSAPTFNDLLREHKSARKAADAYLKWCAENGCTPKFVQFSKHPNYYKMLEDFTCDVGGEYKPQGPIRMRDDAYPKNWLELVEQGLGEDDATQARLDEALSGGVDDLANRIVRELGVDNGSYSLAIPPDVGSQMSVDDLMAMAAAGRIAKSAGGDARKATEAGVRADIQRRLAQMNRPSDDGAVDALMRRANAEADAVMRRMENSANADIMNRLSERQVERYMASLRAAGKKGIGEGAKATKAERRLVERQAKILADAIAAQTGISVNEVESYYGIDLAETVIAFGDLIEDAQKAKAGEAAEGDAETGETDETDGADGFGDDAADVDPAVKKEREARIRKFVQDWIAKAYEADSEWQKKREERKAKRKAAEKADKPADTDEEEGGDEGDLPPTSADFAQFILDGQVLDLKNPNQFAQFIRIMCEEKWKADHGLNKDAYIWGDPIALQHLRMTAAGVYDALCRKLMYSNRREQALRQINSIENAGTIGALVNAMEFTGRIIAQGMVTERRRDLVKDIDRLLEQGFGAKGRFQQNKEDIARKVSGFTELWAREIRKWLWVGDEKKANELQKCLEELAGVEAAFKVNDRDPNSSKNYNRNLLKMEVLTQFGGLYHKSLGEITDARAKIMERLEHDTVGQQMLEREERTRAVADMIEKAVDAGRSVTYDDQHKGKLAKFGQSVSRYAQQHLDFKHLLLDLARYCKDDGVRARYEAWVDELQHDIQRRWDRTQTERRQELIKFRKAVESIYGKSYAKVMQEMMRHDARFDKFGKMVERYAAEGETDVVDEMIAKRDGRPSLKDRVREITVQMSKGQALQLYVSMQQKGYIDNVVRNGRQEQSAELRRLFGKEDLRLVEWLGNWYDENRKAISEVSERIFGLPVEAEEANYFPVKPHRPSQGLNEIDSQAWSPFPPALTARVRHGYDFDVRADIFGMWAERMQEQAQWKNFAELGIELRGILGRQGVQSMIKDQHGEKAWGDLKAFVNDILNGGAKVNGRLEFWDEVRGWTALAALGGNIGVTLKQTTSIPAFAFEVGWANMGKYLTSGLWTATVGLAGKAVGIDSEALAAMREIFESDQRKNRWDSGNSDEVANAFRMFDTKPSLLKNIMKKSMAFNKIGDVIPALLIGQGIYRAYQAQGLSKEEAMNRTWEIINRTQQTGQMDNLTAFQRRSALGRFVTQFQTTVRQYTAYEIAAIRRFAARPSGKTAQELASATILNGVLASLYYWGGAMWQFVLGRKPDDETVKGWIESILTSCWGSLFMLGSFAGIVSENLVTGGSRTTATAPSMALAGTVITDVAKIAGMGLADLAAAVGYGDADYTVDDFLKAADHGLRALFSPYRDASKVYRNYFGGGDDGRRSSARRRRGNDRMW